jgi:hypothetical protein
MSAQAVWKRWKRRIEPSIERVNPNFSSASFRLTSRNWHPGCWRKGKFRIV